MLIHELAARVELSVDTIRFYEKQGLLDGAHFSRQANNYRVYTEAAVARLQLVRQGQAAGITLREMRAMIHDWEANAFTQEQKETFFRGKIEEIDRRIASLLQCRAYLESKLATTNDNTTQIAEPKPQRKTG